MKGELTWTERSRTGINELSKSFHALHVTVTLSFIMHGQIDVHCFHVKHNNTVHILYYNGYDVHVLYTMYY